LVFSVPDDLVETVTQRAAAIVLERCALAESEPLWLTLDQAAQRLDCSTDAVRMRVKRGRLVARHQGRRVYVSRQSVDGLS
jgi:excisionase family DNA binding protein